MPVNFFGKIYKMLSPVPHGTFITYYWVYCLMPHGYASKILLGLMPDGMSPKYYWA